MDVFSVRPRTALLLLGAALLLTAGVLAATGDRSPSPGWPDVARGVLPQDWSIFAGDGWTIGLPPGGHVATVANRATLSDGDQETLLTVDWMATQSDADAATAALAARSDIQERAQFLFAGYPAVTYRFLDEQRTIVVEHPHATVILTTPDADARGIDLLFATFRFTP